MGQIQGGEHHLSGWAVCVYRIDNMAIDIERTIVVTAVLNRLGNHECYVAQRKEIVLPADDQVSPAAGSRDQQSTGFAPERESIVSGCHVVRHRDGNGSRAKAGDVELTTRHIQASTAADLLSHVESEGANEFLVRKINGAERDGSHRANRSGQRSGLVVRR